jgi:hypothetical protein
VSPDCTAETSVCRSERKPDWPSDEVDDELAESDVDDDCNRLCRLDAAVLAASVSPESTAFSRLATVEAKLESEDEEESSLELVELESLAKSSEASWPELGLRKSIAELGSTALVCVVEVELVVVEALAAAAAVVSSTSFGGRE